VADGHKFSAGWVTVFWRAYHLGMLPVTHAGQLSFLPSAGRKMSTGQSAVVLAGWTVKAEWLIPFDKRVGGR